MRDDDGRHARSERSRRLLIDALIALIMEGNFSPTSNQVAERALLSQRTLFLKFGTFAQLYDAAIQSRPDEDRVRRRLKMARVPDVSLARLERLECQLDHVQDEIASAINWISTGADPVVALQGVQRALAEAAGQPEIPPGFDDDADQIGA